MNNNEVRYTYHDEDNKPLYEKVHVNNADGSKTFYCQREENGVLVRNLNGCRKVLYKLPFVLYAIPRNFSIFLVEGEKDVESLLGRTLIGSTALGSLEWDDEFTTLLQDADVIVLYDNDKTGIQRKELLCGKLYGRVKRLRVVDLPGLEYREKHGLDITDWFERGNTKEQLLALVNQTPDYRPPYKPGDIVVVDFAEFIRSEIPKPRVLLAPFLWAQGLVMTYAIRGVGKTHVALGIGYAVATGGTFLKWAAPEPKKVLYIDGEMAAHSMQKRMCALYNTEQELELLKQNFLLITPDMQQSPMPNLSTPEGRDRLTQVMADRDLVIVDNLSSLCRNGAENDAESWAPIQEWALDLRRAGKAVLFIHHAGKSGKQRGTSMREDILDVVINLSHPKNYKAQDGACFEVHFEKTRHFSGEDANPFQAHLLINSDHKAEWNVFDIESDPEVERVAALRKEGKTIKEIEKETHLSKSQVTTRIDKAKEQKLLS